MKERDTNIDLLKLCMAFLVVLVHYHPTFDSFFLSYILNDIYRVAVPVFFMLSGFYLKKISDASQTQRWISKIITIYIIWMTIYFMYYYFLKGDKEHAYYLLTKISDGWYHLWYFPALIMAYSVAYIIKDKSTLKIIIILSLLLSALYYLQIITVKEVKLGGYRNFIFMALPCIIIGMLIFRFKKFITKNFFY
ncbi:acyltransferase family protein [Providencia sp. wls1943]|uniref:Polysaccharide polymerase n=1 Tax=Providencia alcalifaciens TaxID=126385 RepID=A0A346CLM0_9GAMM|nr:polysaccharide polymerase [Providencia alcalifaciens]MTB67189.1 acyltransferase family protein [Providencia sp. wls1943]